MIKGIILDWGGVICENPAQPIIDHCAKVIGVSSTQLKKHIDHHILDFQVGLDETIFWQLIYDDLKLNFVEHASTIHLKSLWFNAFETIYKEQKLLLKAVRELHQLGYKIGFLSNTEIPASRFHKTLHYHFIQHHYFSCLKKKAKPSRVVYHELANTMQLKTNELIMVDDKLENILAAKKCGMKTILFRKQVQFLRELKLLTNLS